MKDLLSKVRESATRGEDLVLAVIVSASGSTPRGPGAMLLVGAQGRIWGTIGGAALDQLAIEEGKKLLVEKHSALRNYHSGESAGADAKDGGEISVFFLYLNSTETKIAAIMEAGIASFSALNPCWLVFSLDERKTGLGILGEEGITAWLGEEPEDPAALVMPRPGQDQQGKTTWFSQALVPDGFVYIFGGGHVAQELAPLLCHLDFRCVVFDDREEFSRPELFPEDCHVIRGDFENIGVSLSLTEKDYVVVVTRGHAFDFQVEAFALRSQAPYIGVIGSDTKHGFVRSRLEEAGFSPEELDAPRIHAPIGINIQSKTPAEVAVSIAGELILTRAELAGRG